MLLTVGYGFRRFLGGNNKREKNLGFSLVSDKIHTFGSPLANNMDLRGHLQKISLFRRLLICGVFKEELSF